MLKLPINCYQVLNLTGSYNKKPAAKHRAERVSSRSILQWRLTHKSFLEVCH